MRSKHWIVDEKGNIIMGEGRREIFENIQRTGSINQTAKIMKMSYKGVWSKIRVTESYLNTKIIATDKTRGSSLTKEGKELLKKYNKLKDKCMKSDNKYFKEIFQKK